MDGADFLLYLQAQSRQIWGEQAEPDQLEAHLDQLWTGLPKSFFFGMTRMLVEVMWDSMLPTAAKRRIGEEDKPMEVNLEAWWLRG